MMELESRCEAFMQCLDEKRFYDAHEALEALWFPRRFERSDEVMLLKGFINASVSFELIKRGRPEPARRVWKNYEKYVKLLRNLQGHKRENYEAVKSKIDQTRREHGHLYGCDGVSSCLQEV